MGTSPEHTSSALGGSPALAVNVRIEHDACMKREGRLGPSMERRDHPGQPDAVPIALRQLLLNALAPSKPLGDRQHRWAPGSQAHGSLGHAAPLRWPDRRTAPGRPQRRRGPRGRACRGRSCRTAPVRRGRVRRPRSSSRTKPKRSIGGMPQRLAHGAARQTPAGRPSPTGNRPRPLRMTSGRRRGFGARRAPDPAPFVARRLQGAERREMVPPLRRGGQDHRSGQDLRGGSPEPRIAP